MLQTIRPGDQDGSDRRCFNVLRAINIAIKRRSFYLCSSKCVGGTAGSTGEEHSCRNVFIPMHHDDGEKTKELAVGEDCCWLKNRVLCRRAKREEWMKVGSLRNLSHSIKSHGGGTTEVRFRLLLSLAPSVTTTTERPCIRVINESCSGRRMQRGMRSCSRRRDP